MAQKALRRSSNNRILTGLCAGIGEYFGIDPWIVRIIVIISGVGPVLYLILSAFIPSRYSQ